jgi:hypothetical protein
MEIFRAQQHQLTEYQKQVEVQTQELGVLKQAFQTIVGDEPHVNDETGVHDGCKL